MKNAEKKKIYILGGGLGGLTAAVVLGYKGYRVTLIEKNEHIGGKMNFYSENGFRFDIGPHVLTYLPILEDFFKEIDKQLYEYLDLINLEVINRFFFNDLTLDFNSQNNESVIQKYFSDDYHSFMKYSLLSKRYFLSSRSQFQQYQKMRVQDVINLLLVIFYKPFESLESYLNRNFLNEKLKDIFRLYGFYIGTDSKNTLNIFSMLKFMQEEYGIYYARGGIYKIAEAFETLAIEFGVDIIKNTKIEKLNLKNRYISEIILDKGQIDTEHSIVISNIDYSYTHELIQDSIKFKITKPKNLSQSAFIILLGIDYVMDKLSHHNTIFSGDILKEYEYIFEKNKICEKPVIGIDVVTKDDPNLAPQGCENLFIMVNVSSNPCIEWEKIKENYCKKIINIIEEKLNINLTEHILVKKIITPLDLASMYNIPNGAIYGPGTKGIKGILKKNNIKSNLYKNLYFCGGTVNPGSGIPMVISSGLSVSKKIIKDYS